MARAVAVLGDSSPLPAVAALTGLDEATVAARGGRARARRHPAPRAAARLRPSAGARRRLPRRSRPASASSSTGAPRRCSRRRRRRPRRSPRSSCTRRAAANARPSSCCARPPARRAQRGGPDSAMAYLSARWRSRRPPSCAGRCTSSSASPPPRCTPRRRRAPARAYDSLTDPEARATAAFVLAQSLLFTGHAPEGGELARRAAAERRRDDPAGAPGRRGHRRLLRPTTRGAHPARATAAGPGSATRMLTAATASSARPAARPPRECEALALEAWEGGELLASASGLFWSAALVALSLSDSPHTDDWLAPRATRRTAAARCSRSRRRSSGAASTCCGRRSRGGRRVAHAGERAPGAVGRGADRDLLEPRHPRLPRRGDRRPGAARGRCSARRRPPRRSPTAPTSGARARRAAARRRPRRGGARHRRAMGRRRSRPASGLEAVAVAEGARPRPARPPRGGARHDRGGARAGARLRRAGDDRALPARARRLARGRSRPARGRRAAGGDHAAAGARPRARGARRRAAPRPPATEAREPLRQALELAEACACPPLVEAVRSELYAAGARPRTPRSAAPARSPPASAAWPRWRPAAGRTARSPRPCS